jgi:predicted transcriptional regulator YheO
MASQFLESYIPMVTAVGKTIGIGEILLYDFTIDPPAVLAKEGGITGREAGSKASTFLLDLVREMQDKGESMRLNYETATKSGKPLKSTTLLITGSSGKLEGVFSLNIDMSAVSVMKHFINRLTGTERAESNDEMPQNAQEFLSIMIKKGIESISKPSCYFDKKDNIKVVRFLNSHNIFSIKGSTDTLAAELNVSKYTIYNYIEEVRNA